MGPRFTSLTAHRNKEILPREEVMPLLKDRAYAQKLLEELKVPERLCSVLQAGWGCITIRVSEHKIVHVTHEIGEQVKLDLDI